MTISIGDKIPSVDLNILTDDGPGCISTDEIFAGKKVAIFGLPGAFTRTCSSAHVPSFIRTRAAFEAKGVQDIICVSVNDPFVMHAWGESSGANAAGLSFLADSGADFTKAIGMNFTAPAVGFFDRSVRYALYAEDGVVQVLHREESPGVCEASAGEALLAAI